MVRYALYPSPFGMLQIGCEDETVVSISSSVNCGTHDPSPVSERANAQLQEYFLGKRSSFDFPMKPAGTPSSLPSGISCCRFLMVKQEPTVRLLPPSASPALPARLAWPVTAIPCGLQSPAIGL